MKNLLRELNTDGMAHVFVALIIAVVLAWAPPQYALIVTVSVYWTAGFKDWAASHPGPESEEWLIAIQPWLQGRKAVLDLVKPVATALVIAGYRWLA